MGAMCDSLSFRLHNEQIAIDFRANRSPPVRFTPNRVVQIAAIRIVGNVCKSQIALAEMGAICDSHCFLLNK